MTRTTIAAMTARNRTANVPSSMPTSSDVIDSMRISRLYTVR